MRSLSWLNNRNVIITGCSSGIGRDIARILAKHYNCAIFGVARDVGKLESLKAELLDKFTYISADVSVIESWISIKNEIIKQNFKADIIINNAGIIHPIVKYDKLSVNEISSVVSINLMSIFYSISELMPILKESQYGSIINISSASAYMPVAGSSVYSATKSAILSYSEALKQELYKEHIYVAAVMPGPVITELYNCRSQQGEECDKIKDSAIKFFGISSQKAAIRIIRAMRFQRTRITVDILGFIMDVCYRISPNFTTFLAGMIMRKFPLKTYRELFKDEREKKFNNKKNKKNIK